MIIQYVSDVHLEMRKDKYVLSLEPIPKQYDGQLNIMILAGDIGNPFKLNYNKFLGSCSLRFDQTFVITGNHEYYATNKKKKDKCYSMEETDAKVDELCKSYANVTFLTVDKPAFVKDVKFVGCTLWTETDSTAEMIMNDYQRIYTCDPSSQCGEKRLINHHDIYYNYHLPMKHYLTEEITNSKCENIVVATHHGPSHKMLSNSHTIDERTNKYYATDFEYLFKSPVKLWVSGHTHYSKDIEINGIRSVSNCFGYPTQLPKHTLYNKNSHFVI